MTIRKYKSVNKGSDRKVELMTRAKDINITILDSDSTHFPVIGITLSAADAHDIAQAILAEVEKPEPKPWVYRVTVPADQSKRFIDSLAPLGLLDHKSLEVIEEGGH